MFYKNKTPEFYTKMFDRINKWVREGKIMVMNCETPS